MPNLPIQRFYTNAVVPVTPSTFFNSSGSPVQIMLDLSVGSVFVIDCTDLQIRDGYSYILLDTKEGAIAGLPGKSITYSFKTRADSSGNSVQALVITFSPNFSTSGTSATYRTSVVNGNPNPVISLINDGSQFSVQTSSYVVSSAETDVIPPHTDFTTDVIIAGSNYGYMAYSSDNGTTWELPLEVFYRECFGMAYNGSMWVAVGEHDGGVIKTSTDGKEWTVVPTENHPFDNNYSTAHCIAWNSTLNIWLAGGVYYSHDDEGNNITSIAYSTNGTNWNNASVTLDQFCDSIATSGRYCVAVGKNIDSTRTVSRSTNGSTWEESSGTDPLAPGYGRTIATNGHIWVVGGTNFEVGDEFSQDSFLIVGGGSKSLAWSDNNGLTWTHCTNDPFVGGECISVATDGTRWVAGGSNENDQAYVSLAYSPDGKTWIPVTGDAFSVSKQYCTRVTWNGIYWFASGDSNSAPILRSRNGIDWTTSLVNPFSTYDYPISFGVNSILPFTPIGPNLQLSNGFINLNQKAKGSIYILNKDTEISKGKLEAGYHVKVKPSSEPVTVSWPGGSKVLKSEAYLHWNGSTFDLY